ncbi:MAG: CDP-diacylglycerol--glycerol-3-phosphate 3-phosphatidyltransferase [Myxococcota bacterium]|jgi:CDP-diacylglycerol--glycerol-3-phosphate 3-phosphatidyltransferase
MTQPEELGHISSVDDDAEAEIGDQIFNVPNTITLVRISVVPLLLFMPLMLDKLGSQIMAWTFIVAVLTDVLDGYIARSWKMVTRLGKLLDPLADKLLVTTALIMMLAVDRLSEWEAGMVVIIVARELAVTGLRGIASAEGHVVAASGLGKLKTLAQNSAVIALLFHYPTFGLPAREIGMTLLALASALTLWSGWVYFSSYFGWRRQLSQQ